MWLWRASWPKKAEIVKNATDLLATSLYKEILLNAIALLSPHTRSQEPATATSLLETHGVPAPVTLDLCVQLGIALKHWR